MAAPACHVCVYVSEKMACRIPDSADVYRHNSTVVMGSAGLFSFGNDSGRIMPYVSAVKNRVCAGLAPYKNSLDLCKRPKI